MTFAVEQHCPACGDAARQETIKSFWISAPNFTGGSRMAQSLIDSVCGPPPRRCLYCGQPRRTRIVNRAEDYEPVVLVDEINRPTAAQPWALAGGHDRSLHYLQCSECGEWSKINESVYDKFVRDYAVAAGTAHDGDRVRVCLNDGAMPYHLSGCRRGPDYILRRFDIEWDMLRWLLPQYVDDRWPLSLPIRTLAGMTANEMRWAALLNQSSSNPNNGDRCRATRQVLDHFKDQPPTGEPVFERAPRED